MYVIDGSATLECDNRTFLLTKKSAIVIPRGPRRLTVSANEYCHKKSIGITGLALKSLAHLLNLNEPVVIEDFDSENFDRIYDNICSLLDKKNPQTVQKLSTLAYQILLEIAVRKEFSDLPFSLTRVVHFMEQNLFRKLTLEDVCLMTGCSRETIFFLFKKHFHSSPMKYLKKLRLDYARHLLEDGNIRIKEIALHCGYRNQLYFSNDFRKAFGVSPKVYREQAFLKAQGQETAASAPPHLPAE